MSDVRSFMYSDGGCMKACIVCHCSEHSTLQSSMQIYFVHR